MTSIFLHGPGFWGLRRARGAAQSSTSGGDLASQLEGVAPPVFDDPTLGATTGRCRTRSVAHKALVAERTGQIRANGPIVSPEQLARSGADAIERAAGRFPLSIYCGSGGRRMGCSLW